MLLEMEQISLEKKIKGEEGNALFKKKIIIHRRIQYIFVLFVIIEYKSQQEEKFKELQDTAALQPSLSVWGGWTDSD